LESIQPSIIKIISSKRYKYDFVYITYCTSYGNSGSVISTNSNLDIDANDIYKRHKEIIELFGKKFKDRRLVIKLQSWNIYWNYELYPPN